MRREPGSSVHQPPGAFMKTMTTPRISRLLIPVNYMKQKDYLESDLPSKHTVRRRLVHGSATSPLCGGSLSTHPLGSCSSWLLCGFLRRAGFLGPRFLLFPHSIHGRQDGAQDDRDVAQDSVTLAQ